jgi:hypothetical protein
MKGLSGVVRRLRYGKPIVIVSGLPRSGTSMAMRMLEAGGMPILQDGIRTADISNPRGYYEFEPVKELDKRGDVTWLADARGKAVKIISCRTMRCGGCMRTISTESRGSSRIDPASRR